ncbi:MAG: glycosyltransferase [candidate division WOR-3 bacterium]|nr:glycosyltransferase [candidate division WOR-3 bacterium]
MKRSDKILIVSYYYPPYVFGGSLRMHYLSKYLEEKGYSVSVITAQPGDEKHTTVINDPFPSSSIKKKNPGLRKYNPMPDSMFFWSIRVSLFIRKHHKKYSRIIISIPPYSASLFPALMLPVCIRNKIIIDIRDSWSDSPLMQYGNILYRKLDEAMEKFTYSKFNDIVSVTEGIRDDCSKKTDKTIHYIRNPLDSSEAPEVIEGDYLIHPGKMDNIRFNSRFLQVYDSLSSKLTIRAAGIISINCSNYPFIESMDELNRKSMLKVIGASRAGLIMLDFDLSCPYYIFPSKLLDYILCRKPVLYVGPPTIASEFIENEGIGIAVTSHEREDIIRGIERILEGEFTVSDELIESLDYHLVFEKYLRLLDTATLNSGGP